jgi:hypothetical protein
MIVYHGTTDRGARRIALEGFLPRKPSRRVWFAKSRAYAEGRARTKARRAHDRPVVLTCTIDVTQIRRRLGARRVFLRSHPGVEAPTTPEDLARWVNRLLGLRAQKGVGRSHPGIDRLSRWVRNRLTSQPGSRIALSELLQLARQWLPEHFDGVEIDPQLLKVRRRIKTLEVRVEAGEPAPPPPTDPNEDRAIELLADPSPRRRARGLGLLAQIQDPDLFDWCAMFLDDEAAEVQVAALRTMLRCQDSDPDVIAPLAESPDTRVRAAAIAAMAKHSGRQAPAWFERGLKDPAPCVRLETAAVLSQLDPAEHRAIFELALYDPNPQVAHLAAKLTAGKGFSKAAWRRGPSRP